jgi:hypothetical protein
MHPHTATRPDKDETLPAELPAEPRHRVDGARVPVQRSCGQARVFTEREEHIPGVPPARTCGRRQPSRRLQGHETDSKTRFREVSGPDAE